VAFSWIARKDTRNLAGEISEMTPPIRNPDSNPKLSPETPLSAEGYAFGAVRWRLARRTCARGITEWLRFYSSPSWFLQSQVRATAPSPPLSAALGFCLADGSLPRAMRRLAGGDCRPHAPAFCRARLLYFRRLATAGR